jgi:hypothetical protein
MGYISPLRIEPYNDYTISLILRDSLFYTGCFYYASIPSYINPNLLNLLLLSLDECETGSCEIGTYYYSEEI